MWLADITDECILGLDFLQQYDCQVELQDGVLYISNKQIPLHKISCQNYARCYRIWTQRLVTLPSHAEFVIPTQLDRSFDVKWTTSLSGLKHTQFQIKRPLLWLKLWCKILSFWSICRDSLWPRVQLRVRGVSGSLSVTRNKKKMRTTPLYPHSDGIVEGFNHTLESQLAIDEDHKYWDRAVPLILMAIRSAIHESTRCTLKHLMFGRNLRMPIDLLYGRPEELQCATGFLTELQKLQTTHDFVRNNLKVASIIYDFKLSSTSFFQRSDSVWLYNPQK